MLGMMSDSVQRGVSSAMRSVDVMDSRTRENDRAMTQANRELMNELRAFDRENQARMKQLEQSTAERIEKTLANPLANEE
jgi:hypothetical protein